MKLYLVQTYTGFLADGYIELCELKINCNSFTVTVNTMPAKICWLKNKWWAFFLSFFFFFFWVVNQFISNTYTWRVKLCLAMFGHIIYSNKCWIHKKWVTSISIFFFHLYLMNPLRKENNLSPKKRWTAAFWTTFCKMKECFNSLWQLFWLVFFIKISALSVLPHH